ncbi:PQQ-binding-like beta-propeller repeat protein [Acidobacteriota bacterium]
MIDTWSGGKKVSPRLWYNLSKKVVIVSGVLACIVSLLLILNYIQIKSVDPLNSPAVAQLMEQLKKDPGDAALKNQIRALDLLARKAYFTHRWQVRTGSYLLFAFILAGLLAMKYMNSLEPRHPDLLSGQSPDDLVKNRSKSRKYLLYGALGIFCLAIIFGFLTENEVSKIGKLRAQGKVRMADFPGLDEIRQNWPGFRGPEGNGWAYNTDVPTEWNGEEGQNILWKISLPLPGYNSPIIWGKRIFLSGADRSSQAVYCLDADSGEVIWQHELNDVPGTQAERPRISEDTGYAAPTMATDGQRVFVIFANGDTACLDFEGNRIWAKNLGMPDNHYGHSSSLIVYQDLLLVQFDQNIGGYLIALRARTGDVAYETERDTEISWASPVVVNTGDRDEVILNSNPYVISYDPRTGEELWKVRCMQGEVAPSVAYADGMVFAVNDYARLVGIQLGETPEVAWEYIDDLSEVSSPVASDDLVFMAASYGTVTCFDGKTGERYWLEEFDEGFYSSPILVGDKVYLMDMAGVVFIFKAAKEYELVGRCELGERAMAIPAFMFNRIYIRGIKNLYCIGNE